MDLPPYSIEELTFAYRCYVYFRWHTYEFQPVPMLTKLSPSHLETIHPEIRILELTASETDMALLASLQPFESVSTAASKLKGASSKLVRELEVRTEPKRTLGAGYFAITTGDNNSEQVDAYLNTQAEHHGYVGVVQPPVWIQNWELTETELGALQTKHAVVALRWHIVLSTWNRVGFFTAAAAEAICDRWAKDSLEWQVRIQQISVVPDHLHAAIWTHPTVAPGELVTNLMNSSQETMRDCFPGLLIDAGQPRLWKPGAYVGSFGDLTKAHIRNYLRKWELKEQASARDHLT